MNSKREPPPTVAPNVPLYYGKRIRLQIQQFPGMPVFISTLLADLNNDDLDMEKLSYHIRIDPGVTTNLLRLANSVKYGSARAIVSVQEALVRLGLRRSLNILVAFHLAGHLSKPLSGYGLEPREMLAHALYAAIGAERFARRIGMPHPDHAFTAALLHDIGKVILSDYVEKETPLIMQLLQQEHLAFDEAEQAVLGIDHAEAGAAILDHWHFPDLLIQAARHHHQPHRADTAFEPLNSAVHLADFLSYSQGLGAGRDGFSYRFSQRVEDHLSLTKKDVEAIAAETFEEVQQTQKAFQF